MKKTIYLLAFLLTSIAWGQSVTVDGANAQVSFLFLDDDVEGTLSGFQFTGTIDLRAIEDAEISGSVVTKTLDTNNWFRSRHLRAKKFFNAKEYPTLDFKSTKVTGNKDAFTVEGLLTIKGIEKSVAWQFTNSENTFVGKTTINSQDFDINIHDEKSRNKLEVTIQLPYSLQ